MKKIFLVVLSLALISTGTLFGQNLVLFENGQWNAALGNVKVTGLADNDRENAALLKFENGAYATTNGIRFDFENPIDVTAYRYMTIETAEKTLRELGNWVGGALYIYHATAFPHSNNNPSAGPSPTHIAQYGFWGNNPSRNLIQSSEGNIQFDFTARPTHREVVGRGAEFTNPDFKNFAGFRIKKAANPRGTITVQKITLHN